MKKWLVLMLVCLMALPALGSAQSYEATAAGFGGEINVTLDVEEGKIVGAQITGEGETPDIGGAALETLQNQLVEAKTWPFVPLPRLPAGTVPEAMI